MNIKRAFCIVLLLGDFFKPWIQRINPVLLSDSHKDLYYLILITWLSIKTTKKVGGVFFI